MLHSGIASCTFQVEYSSEDGEWVCTCSSYPSMSCLDISPTVALADMMRLVSDILSEGDE